jgi:hypothetical protein
MTYEYHANKLPKTLLAIPRKDCEDCIFDGKSIHDTIDGVSCITMDCTGVSVIRRIDKARLTDPATSHAAAEASKPKRVSWTLRERILIAMNGGHYEPRPQGWTGHELAEHLKVPLNSITPRFKELVDEGKIKDSGERRERQIVWVLV